VEPTIFLAVEHVTIKYGLVHVVAQVLTKCSTLLCADRKPCGWTTCSYNNIMFNDYECSC